MSHRTFFFAAATIALTFAPRVQAGSLGFRNDTDTPIIVQCLSIVNNRVVQGRPHTLQPGDTCSDLYRTPGAKRILIADAKQPTKVLFQENIVFAGPDQLFSIQDDSPNAGNQQNPRARKPAISSVKIVPVELPAVKQGPGQRGPVQPQQPLRIKH
jgi:hypothetical protein